MKLRNLLIYTTILFLFLSTSNVQGDISSFSVPLNDEITLPSYSFTAVSDNVDIDDYMLDGKQLYFPFDEYLEAGDGKTGGASGTSYISLEESTLLGDYASESESWSEYAFIETTYGSATEGNTTSSTVAYLLSG